MERRVVRIAVVLTLTLFTVGAGRLTSHGTRSPASLRPERWPATFVPADNPPPAVDLYGNEVSDAVAKYSLDPGGALYEEHSPQTELPRLASPKS
jgi:hypothetical protein